MIKMAGTEEYIDEEGDSKIKDFFEHLIRRTEESQSSFGSVHRFVSEVLTHVDLLERTIRLPDQLATIVTHETDEKRLHDLRLVFTELLEKFLQHFGNSITRPTSVTYLSCKSLKNGRPGGPSTNIPPEVLEDLRGIGFTWVKIARVFRVSRWTIMRRVRLFDLEHLSRFITITDEEINGIQ